jgi:aminopeptidase
MADPRIEKLARVLVDYSTAVQPGEKVLIEGNTLSEPLVREIYKHALARGAHAQVYLMLPDEDELFYGSAGDEQLDFTPVFPLFVMEQADVLIRARASQNTRALSHVDPARQSRRQKALGPVMGTMMRRSAEGKLRWVVTQHPVIAYAMEAEMGLHEYEDFVYAACHVDEATPDPVAHWKSVQAEQAAFVARFEGHERVELKGPNVDLRLSIQGRKFLNACGQSNMPDGEIFTGPVEDSVEGWVRFTYPAIYAGRAVEGVELRFERGQVVQATARTNQDFLQQMLATDAGVKYLGEFAVGTNFQIDRFTRNILYDEKIGGTFHMALGASYPETGGKNLSAVHWDMICDMREDSEIRVDGEVAVRNGRMVG